MKYSVKVSYLRGTPKTQTFKVSARSPEEAQSKVRKKLQTMDPFHDRPVSNVHRAKKLNEGTSMKLTKSQLKEMIRESILEQTSDFDRMKEMKRLRPMWAKLAMEKFKSYLPSYLDPNAKWLVVERRNRGEHSPTDTYFQTLSNEKEIIELLQDQLQGSYDEVRLYFFNKNGVEMHPLITNIKFTRA